MDPFETDCHLSSLLSPRPEARRIATEPPSVREPFTTRRRTAAHTLDARATTTVAAAIITRRRRWCWCQSMGQCPVLPRHARTAVLVGGTSTPPRSVPPPSLRRSAPPRRSSRGVVLGTHLAARRAHHRRQRGREHFCCAFGGIGRSFPFFASVGPRPSQKATPMQAALTMGRFSNSVTPHVTPSR
jgi:hypothetical protein